MEKLLCLILPCLNLLSSTPNKPILEGTSTIYWENDGHNNGTLGCKGAALRKIGNTKLSDELPIIATRGKKSPVECGQWVMIENIRTGKYTVAVKLDTGTYSCYNADNKRITALVCPLGWKRKSILDMTLKVARAIDHNGLDKIRVYALSDTDQHALDAKLKTSSEESKD